MNTPVNDALTEEEAFEYAYGTFIEFVEILAMSEPGLQCKAQGNYNTAYELKLDVTGGAYMFNLPKQPLSDEQRDAILALVKKLESMPQSVLQHENTSDGNLSAMSDPWWVPVHDQAKKLIKLLEPATDKNKAYFKSLE